MEPTSATVAISPITLAVLALLPPLLLAGVTGWITSRKEKRDAERALAAAQAIADLKREEKLEDWRRQDEVADRAAKAAAEVKIVAKQAADAADLLVAAQKETIARTDEVARIAAENDRHITEKLEEGLEQGRKIHILVNSDMTAARTAERDSLKLLVIALKRLAGSDEIDTDEIGRVEKRIAELDQILADRHAAQEKVEAEAARQHDANGRPDRRKPTP